MYKETYMGTLRFALVITLLTAVGCGTTKMPPAQDAKADSNNSQEAKKQPKTGAELYAMHCGRCHPERYPTEWNEREWQTVMLEMRVRANLPASQAKEILSYLKEESGK